MTYSKSANKAMLKKAGEKFASARDDFNSNRFDSCISNLYFSAFQTITALLISRGDLLKKHSHVRGFVNKELAKNGLIDKSQAKLYNKLMDFRSDAVYNNEVFFDKEAAKELLDGVEQFNSKIVELIKSID